MSFNEDTRVKIPAILHLCRLGYSYLSLNQTPRDESTNIFTDIFSASLLKINPDSDASAINRTFENVSLVLDNEDLGEGFYNFLTVKLYAEVLYLNAWIENNSSILLYLN